jgi:hypothetical protein
MDGVNDPEMEIKDDGMVFCEERLFVLDAKIRLPSEFCVWMWKRVVNGAYDGGFWTLLTMSPNSSPGGIVEGIVTIKELLR